MNVIAVRVCFVGLVCVVLLWQGAPVYFATAAALVIAYQAIPAKAVE